MKTAALLVAAATSVSAHTIMVQLKSGGTTYPVSHGVRTPTYDGPITDVTSRDMACNGGPNPTQSSDKIIEVQAGSSVTGIWRHTLTSGPGDVMDKSHVGPTMAYLKKVDNALTDSGVGGGWFKIQEDGYSGGEWGTLKVINNGGNHVINIPSCIANGQYLLRTEMIALHSASSNAGAQFYMECAQINISGGTGTASPATYSIPGIYKANDPGVLVNVYTPNAGTSYVIPGPRPFSCSGGNTGGNTGGNQGSQPTTMATSTRQSTPTQAPSCQAAQWAQCGGINFTGCTACASPYTCKKSSDHYSQCV